MNDTVSTIPAGEPASPPVEKFCPECSLSRLPLSVPYLSKNCHCGRTVHFIRRDENGKGLQAHDGESLTIPSGAMSFSLANTGGGRMFRPGLQFFLNQIFVGQMPSIGDFAKYVKDTESTLDSTLVATKAGVGIDFTTEAGAKEFVDRHEKERQSLEWYIFVTSIYSNLLTAALVENDTLKAAYAGYAMGTYRGLSLVSEKVFEETIWRGYLANGIIGEADAAVGNRSPAEKEALSRLEPLFERLDDVTLSNLAESGLPIGPRINISHLPEDGLLATAKHHVLTRERKRLALIETRKLDIAEQDLMMKAIAAGVALLAVVITAGVTLWINSKK